MSVINTNISATIATNALIRNERSMSTAMERLSTGMRINSAKDDADCAARALETMGKMASFLSIHCGEEARTRSRGSTSATAHGVWSTSAAKAAHQGSASCRVCIIPPAHAVHHRVSKDNNEYLERWITLQYSLARTILHNSQIADPPRDLAG
mgnify:CR=1 FL=1